MIDLSNIEYIPRTDNSCQTDGFPVLKMLEIFFYNVQHPVIFVDMNVNFIKAKENWLNNSAKELMESCNNDFYKGSYLEKFNESLSDFIYSMKGKVGQSITYSDVIRVPRLQSKKSIYGLTATVFDVDSDFRVLGITLIELSKAVEEELNTVENFKESLISALSHELNNPLNSLIPILEMVPNTPNGANNDLKETARTSMYLLKHKIQDLIDYARMAISDIKLDISEFCVNDLFTEIKSIFKLETEHKSNYLETSVKSYGSSRLIILGDRTKLVQVILKLIYNANKYTDKGKITLIAEENANNFNVVFRVKDTGVGIPKVKLDVLFASLSQKNKQEGEITKLPGLGLEIAKGLCRCMDSKLLVTSEEGKGSEFSFEIPTCRISNFEDYSTLKQTSEISHDKKVHDGSKCLQKLQKTGSISSMKHASFKGPILNNSFKIYKFQKTMQKPKKSMFLKYTYGTNETDLEEHFNISQKIKNYSKLTTKKLSKSITSDVSMTNYNIIPSVKKKRAVLVTDDDYSNRMVICELLKRLKVTAMEAGNGVEALRLVERSFSNDSDFEFDLILMDLNMPKMNGIDSAIKIRETEKTYKRISQIPIIAVTANNNYKNKEACIKSGMQDFISKPVSNKIIKSILENFAPNLINN